jgi:hypothetical protein
MSTDVRKTTSSEVEPTQPAARILSSVKIEQRRTQQAGRALDLQELRDAQADPAITASATK